MRRCDLLMTIRLGEISTFALSEIAFTLINNSMKTQCSHCYYIDPCTNCVSVGIFDGFEYFLYNVNVMYNSSVCDDDNRVKASIRSLETAQQLDVAIASHLR